MPLPHSVAALLHRFARTAAVIGVLVGATAQAAPVPPVMVLARQEQQPLLDTLRDLVSIESGSKDLEGLEKIAALIAERPRGPYRRWRPRFAAVPQWSH